MPPPRDEPESSTPEWAPYALAAALLAALVGGLLCIGIGVGGPRLLEMLSPPDEAPAARSVAEAEVGLPLQATPEEPAPAEDQPGEAPAPVDAVAAPAPAPAPVRPAPRPPARTPPTPRERVAVSDAPTPRETFDALVRSRPAPTPAPEPGPAPEPVPDTVVAAPAPAPRPAGGGDLARWSEAAFEGELSKDVIRSLAAVPTDDPDFTRARTLLYLDAKARDDAASKQGHLALLMSLPENRYDPVLLVEDAQAAAGREDWAKAIRQAQQAERHWARLPPELVFSRKALIYEILAVAQTGRFFASDGRDAQALDQAVRGWQKYRRHVSTKGREDLASRADEQLARLEEITRRLTTP